MSVFGKSTKTKLDEIFSATSAIGGCDENAGINVMEGGKRKRSSKKSSKKTSKKGSKRSSMKGGKKSSKKSSKKLSKKGSKKGSKKMSGGEDTYMQKVNKLAIAVKAEKEIKDGPGLRTILGKILSANDKDFEKAEKDAIQQLKSGKLEKDAIAKQEEILANRKKNSAAKKAAKSS